VVSSCPQEPVHQLAWGADIMNNIRLETPLGPYAPAVEILLAGTAIRIELPPSLHCLAVERYEAVRGHAERQGSPLRDRIRIFYPQGSMAIRSTIRSGSGRMATTSTLWLS
jgi:hypothetical protein